LERFLFDQPDPILKFERNLRNRSRERETKSDPSFSSHRAPISKPRLCPPDSLTQR
jgi:hypothetical protein